MSLPLPPHGQPSFLIVSTIHLCPYLELQCPASRTESAWLMRWLLSKCCLKSDLHFHVVFGPPIYGLGSLLSSERLVLSLSNPWLLLRFRRHVRHHNRSPHHARFTLFSLLSSLVRVGAHRAMALRIGRRRLRLTLLGRAALLIAGELLANVAVWVAAGICLSQADGLLGIAMLAWTLGLRHGLDADHISAIDNATRQMVSMGRLPLTCGLFFSLGHSTIVIAVNIAIAIRFAVTVQADSSVDVYDRLGKVGSIGGIVGTSVSASFLFLVACVNTWFLIGAIRERRRTRERKRLGLPQEEFDPARIQGGGCLVRVIAPILKAVDKPWKLYPVGILFGFVSSTGVC